MSTILTIVELKEGHFRKTGLEVITQARRLADPNGATVAALIIGSGVKDAPGVLGEFGADQVLMAEDAKLETYNADIYKTIVLAAVQKTSPDVILLSASVSGRDMAPRIAANLDAAIASDCTGIQLRGGSLEVEKPLYAGKVFAKMLLSGNPQIASLRPNVFEAIQSRPGQQASVEKIEFPVVSSSVTLKELRKSDDDKLDVSEADVIITGGRGVRSAENFKLLEELAGLLDGAVGATRAVVDSGWRPHADQVGQTGKVVSPNLYVMCGASGSIQHWAGMSGSKCIVAINKDPNAPIFLRADYGIVGDLFEVVPALTAEVRKLRG